MNALDSDARMDLGLRRSLRWRRLRRWLVMLTLLALFVEFRGVPHFRLTDRSRPRASQVDYWSPLGMRQLGGGGPLIVLVPLDRSLTTYAREGVQALLGRAAL